MHWARTAWKRRGLSGLLRRHEHGGYPTVWTGGRDPPGLALRLKDYQVQTVNWMINQELLERGVSGHKAPLVSYQFVTDGLMGELIN